jgi:hypothetical protein
MKIGRLSIRERQTWQVGCCFDATGLRALHMVSNDPNPAYLGFRVGLMRVEVDDAWWFSGWTSPHLGGFALASDEAPSNRPLRPLGGMWGAEVEGSPTP